jgi:hypothetical protein
MGNGWQHDRLSYLWRFTCAANFRWVAISPKRDPEGWEKQSQGCWQYDCAGNYSVVFLLPTGLSPNTETGACLDAGCWMLDAVMTLFLKSYFIWNYSEVLIQLMD